MIVLKAEFTFLSWRKVQGYWVVICDCVALKCYVLRRRCLLHGPTIARSLPRENTLWKGRLMTSKTFLVETTWIFQFLSQIIDGTFFLFLLILFHLRQRNYSSNSWNTLPFVIVPLRLPCKFFLSKFPISRFPFKLRLISRKNLLFPQVFIFDSKSTRIYCHLSRMQHCWIVGFGFSLGPISLSPCNWL